MNVCKHVCMYQCICLCVFIYIETSMVKGFG